MEGRGGGVLCVGMCVCVPVCVRACVCAFVRACVSGGRERMQGSLLHASKDSETTGGVIERLPTGTREKDKKVRKPHVCVYKW